MQLPKKMSAARPKEALEQSIERSFPAFSHGAQRPHRALRKTGVHQSHHGNHGRALGGRADGEDFRSRLPISQVEAGGAKAVHLSSCGCHRAKRAEEAIREQAEEIRN